MALLGVATWFVLGFGLQVAQPKLGFSKTSFEAFKRALHFWVIRVALPALVFEKIYTVASLDLRNPNVFWPAIFPWMHALLSLLCVGIIARRYRWSAAQFGALALTVGLGNTSFVGIPLIRAIVGESGVPTALILDQLGSFLILSTVAVPLSVAFSPQARKLNLGGLLLRAVRFPSFVALVSAILARNLIPGVELVPEILGPLAQSLGPAALIWVGSVIQLGALRKNSIRIPISWGISLKLVMLPLIYVLGSRMLDRIAFAPDPETLRVILLEGAMGSMISAGMVAVEQGYDEELAQLMVGLSVLLSLVTVPLWALGIGSS